MSSKTVWAERKADVRESKLSQLLSEYSNGQKDTITFKNIEKSLNKSEIGKEVLDYLEKNPVQINIYYKVDVPDNLLGIYLPYDDIIEIYGSNTKTIERTAETIIHEVTHRRYNIGGDLHSECVCRAQEYKHRYRKNDLTISELRSIIKEVRSSYSDYNYKWRH